MRRLGFALHLCGFGLLESVLVLLCFVWFRLSNTSHDIDYHNNETLISRSELVRFSGKGIVGKFWDHEVVTGAWVGSAGVYVFFPCVIWLLYVRMAWWKNMVMLMVQLVIYVLVCGLFLDEAMDPKSPLMGFVSTVTSFWVPALELKIFLPLDSGVWKAALKFWLVSVWALVLVATFATIKEVLGDIFLLLVFVPIMRLFVFCLIREITKDLVMIPDFAGEGVTVRRYYGLVFLFCLQTFFGTWTRILVANIEDPGKYALFLIGNTVQEIALRLSVPKQDEFIARIRNCRRPKNQVAPLGSDVSKESRKYEWFTFVIVGDMVGEYIGLFVSFGWMLMFSNAILMLPLPAYALETNPFDDPMPIPRWICYFSLQLLAEILIDTFCFTWEETRHRLPVKQTWASIPGWTKFTIIYLSAIGAAASTFSFLFNGTGGQYKTIYCNTTELCSCAPPPANIYGQYCARTFHP